MPTNVCMYDECEVDGSNESDKENQILCAATKTMK